MKVFKILMALFLYITFITYAYSFELGVGTHIVKYDKQPYFYLGLMKDGGFTSYRDGFSWSSLEREKGVLKIDHGNERLDKIILNDNDKLTKNIMFVLGYGNKFYTNYSYPKNKEEVEKFVSYVKWVALRYKGKIKYYEIWNEWLDGTGVKPNSDLPSDEIFVYLVKRTSETIRNIDPDAILVAGSVNPLKESGVSWALKLTDLGILSYVDGLSIHPYSFKLDDEDDHKVANNFIKIDNFEELLSKKSGKTVPLYITEVGYPTSRFVKGGLDKDVAAKLIVQFTLAAKSREFIKGIWWYDLVDDGKNPFSQEDNLGFFTYDNKPKKSYEWLRMIAETMNKDSVKVNEKDGNIIIDGTQSDKWKRFFDDVK